MNWLSTNKLLFVFFLLFYLGVGFYLAIDLEIYHNDAVSRTANAFFTVFGRDPHLAAIGFVWQPLPSLLQIPLLLMLKPYGLQMLAGPIITSFLGALSVVIIHKIAQLISSTKHRIWSLLVVLLYGLNPMILLYVAIGSSEAIFIASILLFNYFLLKWFLKSGQFDLILAGIFLATSFGSRYEAIPVFIASVVVLAIIDYMRGRNIKKVEGTLLQFFLPFVYTVILWLLANWMIKNDPFYFMNSIYSNSGFTETIKTNQSLMEGSYNSIINSTTYTLKRILLVSPAFLIISFVLFKFGENTKARLYDWMLFTLLAFPYVAILLFHTLQLYKGESLGWLRFFIYGIILATLTGIFYIKKQSYLRHAIVFLLILGVGTGIVAMRDYDYGKEEVSFMQKIENPDRTLDFSRTYTDQKEVARFMQETDGPIIVDTSEGFAIPLFSEDPTRYIITSDEDFIKILKNYSKHASWIIVPDPKGAKNNLVYSYYPKLKENVGKNLILFKEVEGWRIYRIVKVTS